MLVATESNQCALTANLSTAKIMDEPIVWIKEQQVDANPSANTVGSISNFSDASLHGHQVHHQQHQLAWSSSTAHAQSPLVIDGSSSSVQKTNVSFVNQSDVTVIPVSHLDDLNEIDKSTAKQFDIGEYERKLRENTQQTINLLTSLCDYSDQLKQQQKSTLIRLQEEQIKCYQATEQMQKVMQTNSELCERRDQLEREVESLKQSATELRKIAEKKTGIEWHNVDSARIGECFLREPSGAIVLPNTNVFVTDSRLGLFLFSLNSTLIRNVSNADWRWAQAATLLSDGYILVSMMVRESSALPWRRFIMKFDTELNFIAKIEGPKWIENETILRERLCAASNGNIYFAVAGDTFSALYELSPDAKWTELEHKRGQTFVDVQVLAVVGPVTELLLVEQRRGYVCLYGIRESSIAVRRTMTPVERPGAMCIDEQGQMFLHDLRQAKVRHIQTSGDTFEPDADAALAEKSLYTLSANNGFLAATYREDNLVRVHKYKSIK